MTARPVTQQGLAGAKMNSHTGRQIQDAQFFYAKLSEKLSQVMEINASLQQELLDMEKNSVKQIQMQSRLDGLKDEVKTLEVHLRDYNLVLQRGAVQASAADVEDQIKATNVRLCHSDPTDPCRVSGSMVIGRWCSSTRDGCFTSGHTAYTPQCSLSILPHWQL